MTAAHAKTFSVLATECQNGSADNGEHTRKDGKICAGNEPSNKNDALCVCFFLILAPIFSTHQLELHSFVKRRVVCLLLVFYLAFVYELSGGSIFEIKTNEGKLGE